jgi:hypothetical protein
MLRLISLLFVLLLPACSTAQLDKVKKGYAGTVKKVFQVTLQGRDLPGIRLLGKAANVLAPALRRSSETHQYIVGTPTGQITAQSDEEFAVGDCVEVIPEDDAASGPAFRYGQARIVRSDGCTS